MMADRHKLYDDRIYWKEAISLARHGYSVWFILASDSDDRGVTDEGINFIKIKKKVFVKNRFLNFFINTYHPDGLYQRMFKEASILEADVYHFHDLNVNRVALKLKKLPSKPKIIYDVHEPFPENIIDYNKTTGIKTLLKKCYSGYIRWWESRCSRRYDVIITTEENLRDRFAMTTGNNKVEIIFNYTDMIPGEIPGLKEKIYDAVYSGGITELRGAFRILETVKLVVREMPAFKVLFLGSFFPPQLKDQMEKYAAENKIKDNVILKTEVAYKDVAQYYRQSKLGLGIFLPVPTHRIILQIKIFEYFNFGLPIIGSNFGHIRNYILQNNAGIIVDPEDPAEIAKAMIRMLTDENLYSSLSKNATQASANYQWPMMEEKLINIYDSLVGIEIKTE
jgi:glycosyltransferase involved in cell wall biosynthesis